MSLSTTHPAANGNRSSLGSAYILGRESSAAPSPSTAATPPAQPSSVRLRISDELHGSISEIKGQAQFLLYLADQIEDSLDQLTQESDDCQGAFLCKVLAMYSAQLESKHQGLGDKIAETCQEVYVTVREFEADS